MSAPAFSLLLTAASFFISSVAKSGDFTPKNTQKPGEEPPSPEEAAAAIKVPEGFNVTLFAGEPDVRQPIAMAFDAKGRLWVAESYSYHEWEKKGQDRILIFEDKNGDGVHDSRKVFWTGGNHVSGMTVGWGGVWVCDPPNLLFIPDKDRDDVPDGEPEIILDGFTTKGGHNFVNGLTWGIDGWLYGRHGITDASKIGAPGTPETERIDVDCSIWRYHPVTKKFEVVCRGTTNPWGLDWNDVGEMFMTGNVNGHLWHAIPGAYYPRMKNRRPGFGTHIYGRIQMCADHLHHAGSADDWTKTRDGVGVHGKLGGGHSHCGGMIYLGGKWPEEYRNTIFMANTHGRRLNNDSLERHGSGYVGKHKPDFLTTTNPWFRGVSIHYGLCGDVYLSDWCDHGECHDHDGVHRTSGRIYKISYVGEMRQYVWGETPSDLYALSPAKLVELQSHPNEWFARMARRILHERANAIPPTLHGTLASKLKQHVLDESKPPSARIRFLLALHVLQGKVDEEFVIRLLSAGDANLRPMAIRLACDMGSTSDIIQDVLVTLSGRTRNPQSRLHLASSLQRTPTEKRWPIAEALASRREDADDPNIPYLIWYGIKDIVPDDPGRALKLARLHRSGGLQPPEHPQHAAPPVARASLPASPNPPNLLEFTARRLAEADKLESVLNAAAEEQEKAQFAALLAGVAKALTGRRGLKVPESWPAVRDRALHSDPDPDPELWISALRIESVFDPSSTLEIARNALGPAERPEKRNAAINLLAEAKDKSALPVLVADILDDPESRTETIRALARYQDAIAAEALIKRFPKFSGADRSEAIVALTSNKPHAESLIAALKEGTIPKSAVTAFHARRIRSLKDGKLLKAFSDVWGSIKSTKKEQAAQIRHWENQLRPDVLAKADLENGRVQFETLCAACHVLHGKGGNIGPELTGSNRDNLYYLLENIIAPNASLAADYRMSTLTRNDGAVLTGNIAAQNEYTVTLRTLTGDVTTNRKDIQSLETAEASVMPEGLLSSLNPDAVRDLIAYLQD